MSRWVIYKGDEVLGPMTASEIREALRDGVIDPFDLVAKEGSSLRRELVEVDEIFETSRIEYADDAPLPMRESEPASELALAMGEGDIALGGGYIPSRDTLVSRRPVSGHGERPANALALIERRAARRNRRDPKRFYLVDDRGRVLGPLSAGEIQSLFYKGVLTRSVKVLKEGSTSRVPVDKFVAVYSESKRGGARQGAHPIAAGLPSSRQMHRLAMARQADMYARQRLIQILTLVVLVAALAVAGVAVWMQYGQQAPQRTSSSQGKPATKKKKASRPSSGKLPRPKSFTPKVEKRKAPAKPSSVKTSAKPKKQPAARAPVSKKTSSPTRSTVPNKTYKRTVYVPPQAKVPPKAAPVPKAPAPPAAPVAKAPSPPVDAKPQGGPTVDTLINGMNVYHMGPMAYDKGAIERCDTKCSVTFVGAGGSVTVKFFKSLWGPTLLDKSGRVYISGLVQKSGSSVTILLNDVK